MLVRGFFEKRSKVMGLEEVSGGGGGAAGHLYADALNFAR
jgi:hypothetical protein